MTRIRILMAISRILEQACRMLCPACQTEIPLAAGESVGFRDACDRCRADLHVCLICAHYDTTAFNECRESSAERILDKDRANRCEYFRPTDRAQTAGGGREDAMADLEKLFRKD
jgi:phage terminase large subunit GpA-like protein